jgi:hypothetical protein
MNKLSFQKGLVLLTTALFLVGGFFVANTAQAVGNTWNVDKVIYAGNANLCIIKTM